MPLGSRAKDAAVIYFLVGLLAVASFVSGLTAVQARNEAKLTREVLCIGITSNTANPARFDPFVLRTCGDFLEDPNP